MRQLKITKQITKRESPSLDWYLQEINLIPLCTAEEEVELAKRIKKGDEQALQALVQANLRFVISVAKNYQGSGLPLLDMINAGNTGLIKAAKRFDDSKGFKFISYAVWWIRQAILQEIAEHSRGIRIPLNKVSELNRINREENRLLQKELRAVSMEEVADSLGLNINEVQNIKQLANKHMSMDSPFQDGEGNTLFDVIADTTEEEPDRKLLTGALAEKLEAVISRILTKRDADIIRMSFGLGGYKPMSCKEIGEALHHKLTRERVRQVRQKGLQMLQSPHVLEELRMYI